MNFYVRVTYIAMLSNSHYYRQVATEILKKEAKNLCGVKSVGRSPGS